MKLPEWLIRVARKRDASLLKRFSCSRVEAPAWESEIENYIRDSLLDWAFEPGAQDDDPRVLLILHRKTNVLLGVAAHERCELRGPARQSFPATKLQVVAVETSWQGRKFSSGERVSDVVMSAAMRDVLGRVPARYARVYAIVHRENVRSLAVCRRHGLTENLSPVGDFLRPITEHRDDDSDT